MKKTTKICPRCGIEKNISEFPKSKSRTYGGSYCLPCYRIKNSQYRTDNIKSYFAGVIRTSKQGAKKRGIKPYTITTTDMVELLKSQNGLCAVSNIQMTHISGQGRQLANISIDRINNNEGYVIGNIRLVCYAINIMRGKSTVQEFDEFWDLIKMS